MFSTTPPILTIRATTPAVFATLLVLSGCGHTPNDPALATQPYPSELHTTTVADMQAFRAGTSIKIVNSTAHSYRDFDLWLNQRYVQHIASLTAGETITLSLWDFRDEFGDSFNAGGFFRAYEPTPLRMVEIQPAPNQKLIGLITIRAEDVRIKPEPGRR